MLFLEEEEKYPFFLFLHHVEKLKQNLEKKMLFLNVQESGTGIKI